MDTHSGRKASILKNYGFAWVTLGFFAVSLAGHWVFGWFAYLDEQEGLRRPVTIAGYMTEMLRDTFENWQSEFLQLLWQVGGLAILLHIGSPQSKEGDDRMEAKIDYLIEKIDPEQGTQTLRRIDDSYAGRHTDAVNPGRHKRP